MKTLATPSHVFTCIHIRSRLRWEAGLEGVAGSYICRDKAAATAHALWLCVGDLVVEPELHVVLLQLGRGALVPIQQQGLVQAEVSRGVNE